MKRDKKKKNSYVPFYNKRTKKEKNVVTQFELASGSCDIRILSTGIEH